MNILLIFLVVVGVKLPLILVGWIIYRAVNDAPEPEFENDGGDPVKAVFEPGPRTRGPHDSGPALAVAQRRGDKGHDESTEVTRSGSAQNA
ncbi:MAG: hypothetical protein QM648_00515 [Solirubrobacterales bacterium]